MAMLVCTIRLMQVPGIATRRRAITRRCRGLNFRQGLRRQPEDFRNLAFAAPMSANVDYLAIGQPAVVSFHPVPNRGTTAFNLWRPLRSRRARLALQATGSILHGTLLHKSAADCPSPFPGQTYPATSVTGMPSAVKPLSTATLTWNSAT